MQNTKLTPRESEVLELLRQGKKRQEIAEILGASPQTIDVHFRNMEKKLGVKDTTELRLLARQAENSNLAYRHSV